MPCCQSEAGGRAVIENVDRKAGKPDDLREAVDDPSEVVERVGKPATVRHVGLAEAGKIGCDDAEAISEQRDKVAEHMARTRETVQEQDRRRMFWSRLAGKNADPVHVDLVVGDLVHLMPRRCLRPSQRSAQTCDPIALARSGLWSHQLSRLATASRITSMTGPGAVARGM